MNTLLAFKKTRCGEGGKEGGGLITGTGITTVNPSYFGSHPINFPMRQHIDPVELHVCPVSFILTNPFHEVIDSVHGLIADKLSIWDRDMGSASTARRIGTIVR